MITSKTLSELLLLLYAAGESPERWKAFLEALRDATGANGAAILSVDLRRGQPGGFWTNYDPLEMERWLDYYCKINPWMPREERDLSADGNVEETQIILSMPELQWTEFYNDWGLKNDVVYSAAANLGINDLVFRYLCLNRAEAAGEHPTEVRELLQALIPHLKNAARIHERLAHVEGLKAVLDSVALPVFFLDRRGRVVDLTAGAEALAAGEEGLRIDGKSRTLSARLRFGGTLDEFLSGNGLSAFPPSTLLRIERPSELDQVGLLLRLAGSRLAVGPSAYALLILEPSRNEEAAVAAAGKLYGLTRAEIRLVRTLVTMGSLDLAIKALGISRNTARTQMRSVYTKTGTKRQGQVMQLFSFLGRITQVGDDPARQGR